jgi:hypothetical protein
MCLVPCCAHTDRHARMIADDSGFQCCFQQQLRRAAAPYLRCSLELRQRLPVFSDYAGSAGVVSLHLLLQVTKTMLQWGLH